MEGESLDEYVTILRNLAEECEFHTLKDSLVCDMFVLGTNNEKVKEKLLTSIDLTLQKALDIARSVEITGKHFKMIQESNNEISAIKTHGRNEN